MAQGFACYIPCSQIRRAAASNQIHNTGMNEYHTLTFTIYFFKQVKSRPPTFAIFSNSNEIPPAFARFLRSNLQKSMNMHGVPLRFISRKSSGAEVKKNLLAQGKITSTGSGNSSSRPVGLKRSLGGTLFSVRKNRDSQRRRASRIMKARKSN